MFFNFITFATILAFINCREIDTLSKWGSLNKLIKISGVDVLMSNELTVQVDTPIIQLYYEAHCPGCIEFDTTQLKEVVEVLHQYVDVHTYPYGNARTVIHEDGTVEVTCQHGPAECYGNMLHACALDIIANGTEALLFNACMMDQDSNDNSADKCGEKMNINASPIKDCAKSQKGTDLLVHYGEESEKAGFQYVPYVLLNGEEWRGESLLNDVCATFKNPPEPCTQF
ncbi:GILT-like protein 2 [Ostrinia nubilalis]|uniref:GILT-like protein 2 n=1 Tax=Ostrinia nubilalis TaxID=29057 RepID=UPI0030823504